jgi:purine-binding chemotaxis protein CheW
MGASEQEKTMSETPQPYLAFRVGQQWYGVQIASIIEVLHLVALTELPAAPPYVLGLLTIRDLVMPVVDLRLRFGHAEAELHLDTHLIALHTSAGPVALVVDDVDDVEEVTETSAQQGSDSPYVRAVARLEERLILLLDTERIRQETQVNNLDIPAEA